MNKGIRMSGLSTLRKESMNPVAEGVLGGVAMAAALKGISAATDYFNRKTDRNKFNSVINYAKKRHPELRDIPHEKLVHQMGAFYTLAPKVAINKELGTSMLVTTNDYGGNIDLATAKLISEIGSKSSEQGGGNRDEIIGFVQAGKKLADVKGK